MKRMFLFAMIIYSCGLFADWHSWDKNPEEGQLYMTVELTPGEIPERRQLFIITHYKKGKPTYQYRGNGWWDVTKESLWEWCNGGSRLVYRP